MGSLPGGYRKKEFKIFTSVQRERYRIASPMARGRKYRQIVATDFRAYLASFTEARQVPGESIA